MRIRNLMVLLISILVLPLAGQAHDHKLERSVLLTELENIASQLRHAKQRLERHIAVDHLTGPEALMDAHSALLQNNLFRAAMILQKIIESPAFQAHAGRAEAEYLYGKVMHRLGFHQRATAHFANGVLHPATSDVAFKIYYGDLLAHANGYTSLDAITTGWKRRQSMAAQPHENNTSLSYLYGRALYRAGAYTRAGKIFSTIDDVHRDFPRAQHFLGVINLRDERIEAAKKHFHRAYAAWLKVKESVLPQSPSKTVPEVMGPRREFRLVPVVPLTAQHMQWVQLGAAIKLALARLYAHEGAWSRAYDFYRLVPPGAPGYLDAIREGVHALTLGHRYTLAQQVLATAFDVRQDITIRRAVDGFIHGKLLAKSGRSNEAQDQFYSLQQALLSWNSTQPERIETSSRLVEATRWLAPEFLETAALLGEESRALTPAMMQVLTLYAELKELSQSMGIVPVIQKARAFIETIKRRHALALKTVEGLANTEPGLKDAQSIRVAIERLAGRIKIYTRRLETFDRLSRVRLGNILRDIGPILRPLRAEINVVHRTLQQLESNGIDRANARLRDLEAQTVLALPNITYWLKEAISQRIQSLSQDQAKAITAIIHDEDTTQQDFRDVSILDEPRHSSSPTPK